MPFVAFSRRDFTLPDLFTFKASRHESITCGVCRFLTFTRNLQLCKVSARKLNSLDLVCIQLISADASETLGLLEMLKSGYVSHLDFRITLCKGTVRMTCVYIIWASPSNRSKTINQLISPIFQDETLSRCQNTASDFDPIIRSLAKSTSSLPAPESFRARTFASQTLLPSWTA